ncbi:hypothetical protein D9M68_713500 [compost metagenome]
MFDASDTLLLRAGERARFMAEEFAFDDAFRQGSAVDRDERPVAAAAQAMQRRGHDLFARPGFAFDQDVHIRVRDMAQRLLDALHGRGCADERDFVGLHRERGLAQAAIFQHQMALFRGMRDRCDQPVGRVGLGQEIVGAVLHALHGGRDVSVAGDEDDGNVGIDVAHAAEQLQAVDVGHADVAHDHAVECASQRGQCGTRAVVRIHRNSVQLECLGIGAAQFLVVVDEHGVGLERLAKAIVGRLRRGKRKFRGSGHGVGSKRCPGLAPCARSG